MKVHDLKKLLDKLDPNLDVLCYREDADTEVRTVFDILEVTKANAISGRLNNNIPYLKFTTSAEGAAFAIIGISGDL